MRYKSKKKSGKWEVERERCRIETKAPPRIASDAVAMGGVLSKVLRKLGVEDQHLNQILTNDWVSLVGADVARHTRPGGLERDNITIFVDSSVWLNELSRFGKDKILGNIRKALGSNKIKRITLRLDPDASR